MARQTRPCPAEEHASVKPPVAQSMAGARLSHGIENAARAGKFLRPGIIVIFDRRTDMDTITAV